MPLYDTVSGLPLEVESYSLEGLVHDVSTGFTRRTTVISLQGGGHEGVGEDVTYDGDDQGRLQETGPVQPLAGSWTFASFSRRLGELDCFRNLPARRSTATTAGGPSKAPRSTWRSVRPAARWRRSSGGSLAR